MNDPESKPIHIVTKSQGFKFSFTTFVGGYFQFCIDNKNKFKPKEKNKSKLEDYRDIHNTAKIDFTLKYGIAAKDYTDVTTMKDLKPVELQVSVNSKYY